MSFGFGFGLGMLRNRFVGGGSIDPQPPSKVLTINTKVININGKTITI